MDSCCCSVSQRVALGVEDRCWRRCSDASLCHGRVGVIAYVVYDYVAGVYFVKRSLVRASLPAFMLCMISRSKKPYLIERGDLPVRKWPLSPLSTCGRNPSCSGWGSDRPRGPLPSLPSTLYAP
jgi:hypothetical protein